MLEVILHLVQIGVGFLTGYEAWRRLRKEMKRDAEDANDDEESWP